MSKELITPELKSAVIFHDFSSTERAFPNLTEITPTNIGRLRPRFSDLSWQPYFSGQFNYGVITQDSQLKPNEWLEILIPEWVIDQRISAVSAEIEREIMASEQPCAIGAILDAGKYFYQEVLKQLSEAARKKIIPETHVDIKSRYGQETKDYEVRALPPHKIINGRILKIFESVGDSGTTIDLLSKELSKPPYKDVNLQVYLLADKIDAHLETPLSACVKRTLFYTGKKWLVGCGMDTNQRFRQLPFIAIHQNLQE